MQAVYGDWPDQYILGYTIILPLLPFYSERLGASPFVVGLLISTYAICQLISGPIIGSLSDRAGRRPLLIVSQMGTLLGFLILSQATALWLIFVSRVMQTSLSTAVSNPFERGSAGGRPSFTGVDACPPPACRGDEPSCPPCGQPVHANSGYRFTSAKPLHQPQRM